MLRMSTPCSQTDKASQPMDAEVVAGDSNVVAEEVPAAELEKEKEILLAQLEPAQLAKADKIIPGKLQKFYEEKVLTHQLYVKDEGGKKTIGDILAEYSAKCGEKVAVRRFVRFEVGEGIAKETANLAAEVAAMTGVTQ